MIGNHWSDIQSRKDFFEEFARENEFDSLIASNWYSVDISMILASKVYSCAYFVISYCFYYFVILLDNTEVIFRLEEVP